MIAAARAALVLLLTTDPQFVADMHVLGLGLHGNAVTPSVLKGNRPFEQIGQEHYPVWVHDAGDLRGASASSEGGDPDGLVINSTQQDWLGDVELSLVWLQQDYDTSVDQVDGVLPRNPDLSGTCTLAFVADVINARSFRHPTQHTAFTIRVMATIHRDMP
jgi:hypothetical protein